MVIVDEIWAAAAVNVEAAECLARLSLQVDRPYSHLPSSTINWSLEGDYVCRVEECPEYGTRYIDVAALRRHLHSQGHKV